MVEASQDPEMGLWTYWSILALCQLLKALSRRWLETASPVVANIDQEVKPTPLLPILNFCGKGGSRELPVT